MIEFDQVTKVFHKGLPRECQALSEINLKIELEKISILAGPSGSGKSTLLSLTGCLSRPTSGKITLEGEPLSGLPEAYLTLRRRDLFGFVFQNFHLLPGFTVLQNVLIPTLPTGLDPSFMQEKALELLELVRLSPKAHSMSEEISGGEAQRVAVARALILEPKILLADEPTAHLGPEDALTLLEIFQGLRDCGQTIVISSHDPRVLDFPEIDATIHLSNGKVVS